MSRVANFIRTSFELLGILPTTQFRVVISAVPILATTFRYVFSHDAIVNGIVVQHWSPSYEWLGFLLLLAGIDTAHFIGKRVTDADYAAAKKGGPSA